MTVFSRRPETVSVSTHPAAAGGRRQATLALALAAACAPGNVELCQALADKSAHCEYQVADDAVDRCAARLAAASAPCRASMESLGACVVAADCDMAAIDCAEQAGRYHASCDNPNAFGSDW